MSSARNILDFIQIGIIASGGDPSGQGKSKGDFPSDKSSNQKVILPMTHDPEGVKQEHLAFSPMMTSPTSFSQMSFQGHLDPGTQVYFLKTPGETGGIILGQANDLVNHDQGSAGGGQSLLGHSFFQDLFDRETGVNIPPEIQETEEDGVKVRSIKEKNEKHKHSLLKGLPSHNAMQPTTGYKLEEVKEVPTAKQHFDAIPNQDMMGQMPGDISSLGGMLQGLMGGMGGKGGGGGGSQGAQGAGGNVGMGAGIGNQPGQVTEGGETPMDRIQKAIKPELYHALISLSKLTQGTGHDGETTTFITAGRVHTPTYLANAEQLLSQCTTLEDLLVCLHRLQYDTTLFGIENLADAVIEITTAWGNANVIISLTGDIELEYANSNVSSDFSVTMMDPQSSPGLGSSGAGNGGQGQNQAGQGGGGGGKGNMFGKSAEQIQDMMKRLPQNNQKEAKKLHEKVNQEDEFQKIWKFAEKTINGGNPLAKEHFEG